MVLKNGRKSVDIGEREGNVIGALLVQSFGADFFDKTTAAEKAIMGGDVLQFGKNVAG